MDAVRASLAAHARVPVDALVPLRYELTVDYVDGWEANVDVTELYLGDDGLGFRHDVANLALDADARAAFEGSAPSSVYTVDYAQPRRRELHAPFPMLAMKPKSENALKSMIISEEKATDVVTAVVTRARPVCDIVSSRASSEPNSRRRLASR